MRNCTCRQKRESKRRKYSSLSKGRVHVNIHEMIKSSCVFINDTALHLRALALPFYHICDYAGLVIIINTFA